MKMTAITTKQCTKCLITKNVSEFYSKGRGYTSWCKECMRSHSRQRVLDGRDKNSKIKYEEKSGHYRKPKKSKACSEFNSMVREMYKNMKKRSYFSNKDLEISFEQLEGLVKDFCDNNYHVVSKQKHPFKPSIDRIDSSKEYVLGNVKIVWMIENYCKNTFTDEQVLEFCKRKLGLM
jgi:hypothetical protein